MSICTFIAAKYYGFFQKGGLDPNTDYPMYSSPIAKYVKIVTPGREEKLAAVQSLIDKINAIGTVTENSGAAIGGFEDFTGCFIGIALIGHAVFIKLDRTPPCMVHRAVADLKDDLIAEVAGFEVVHHEFKVVDIGVQLAALLQTIGVLVQTPSHHGSGERHGKVEFHMVAGIVPAALNLVDHGGISSPLDSVPFGQRACLLAFVEEEIFLKGFGVVGVIRSSDRPVLDSIRKSGSAERCSKHHRRNNTPCDFFQHKHAPLIIFYRKNADLRLETTAYISIMP